LFSRQNQPDTPAAERMGAPRKDEFISKADSPTPQTSPSLRRIGRCSNTTESSACCTEGGIWYVADSSLVLLEKYAKTFLRWSIRPTAAVSACTSRRLERQNLDSTCCG